MIKRSKFWNDHEEQMHDPEYAAEFERTKRQLRLKQVWAKVKYALRRKELIHLVVKVNGTQVQKYTVRAYRIKSVGTWAGPGTVWAEGTDSVFAIDIPVEVSVDAQD